ncbi:MAG: hypothetical protein ACRCUS_00430 [Anaerovoracaceae bacterium]
MSEFKNKIFLFALGIAILGLIVSFFIIGVDIRFILGLGMGLAVAILNFNILAFVNEKMLSGQGAYVAVGYVARFAIYGGVFIIAVKNSLQMAAGCGIGFLTIQMSIFILFGILPSIKKKQEN